MPLKYNEYVKKPQSKFEYTPKLIKELDACERNLTPFLKYVKIVHPDKGRIRFEPREFQKTILETIKNNRFTVALCSRQVGKTTVIAIYALWYSIFNADKIIGIVSNKQTSAIDILSRIKMTYEELPVWLKPGVLEYSKTFIKFDNGTMIIVSATSDDAFRGRPINLLVCDELAFVRKGIAENFWAANYPTISASEESKIVLISTPNGPFNLFHRLYTQAERKENTFVALKYTWRCVPGRDEKWASAQRKNLGKLKFSQEHEVDFIGSINTLVDKEILEQLYFSAVDPLRREMDNTLWIYEKPIAGCTYVIGCDSAKGTGEHYSAFQVLKIVKYDPLEYHQVAVFFNNRINVYKYSDLLNKMSMYYNDAFLMVENNAEGAAVVNRLWWDHENENLVNSGNKEKDLGIRATKVTRPRAVILMKKLIEDGQLHLVDQETINQLSSFIEDKGNFHGKDMPDDCVSALYWACYVSEMDIWEQKRELKAETVDDFEDDDVWGFSTNDGNFNARDDNDMMSDVKLVD